MGYFKRVTLTCDCDGCEECEDFEDIGCMEWYEHDGPRATSAREYAKQTGWVYRNGEDYCHRCK